MGDPKTSTSPQDLIERIVRGADTGRPAPAERARA